MSTYSLAVAELGQRAYLAANHLSSKSDLVSQNKVALLQTRVQEFIQSCAGRPNFSAHHPALFISVDSLVDSLVNHCSATQARGNGRIATITDHIRTTGSGLRTALPSIRKFLGQQQPIDWHVDRRTGLSFPVDEKVTRTHVTISQLYDKLEDRKRLIEDHAKNGTKPSKEEARQYLLGTSWDAGKILSYTIEGAARSVAFAMPSDSRAELINGGLPLLDAISKVDWEALPARQQAITPVM